MKLFTENYKNQLSSLLRAAIESYCAEKYNKVISEIKDSLFLERDKDKRISLLIDTLKKYRNELKGYSNRERVEELSEIINTPYILESRLASYTNNPSAYGEKDKTKILEKEEELKEFEQFFIDFHDYLFQLIVGLKNLNSESSANKISSFENILGNSLSKIEKQLKEFEDRYYGLNLGAIGDDNTDEIIKSIIRDFKVTITSLKSSKYQSQQIFGLISTLQGHSEKILAYTNQTEKQIDKEKREEIYLYFSKKEIIELSQIDCTHQIIRYIEAKIHEIEGTNAKGEIESSSKKNDNVEDTIQNDDTIRLHWKANIDLLYKIFNDLRTTQQKNFKMKIMLDKATEEDIDYFITTNFTDEQGNIIKSRLKKIATDKMKHKKLLWRGYLNSLVKLFYLMKTEQIAEAKKIGLYDPNDYLPEVINRNFTIKEKNAAGNITNRAIDKTTIQKFLVNESKQNKKALSVETLFAKTT
jgi:hypothetical protein